jgi:hypothetical protein
MNEELFYRGIPVEPDYNLRDDDVVIEGVDKDGRPVAMRFRRNASGKMEIVGD